MVRLNIELSDDTARMLREQERRDGLPVDRIVRDLVESRYRRLAEFRKLVDDASLDFMKTGMTDDEFGDFLEVLKHRDRGVPYDV